MKILIVDDDVDRAVKLKDYLLANVVGKIERIDFSSSSDEAKRRLQGFYYDALIVDVVIPKRLGETPGAEVGFALVGQVFRGRGLRKPEKLIAITAHEEDIETFRVNFEEYCTAVVNANSPSDQWRRRIADSIQYVSTSRFSRETAKGKVVAFTIHGIRTYGEWQSRFKELVLSETEDVEFQNYKYGYFSALAFMIPAARKKEVDLLCSRLSAMFDSAPRKIFVFSHSFGTYLAAETLRRVVGKIDGDVEVTIVLSGSVLPENYDWSFIQKRASARVINDCGSGDYVLSLAKASVLGVGMAGKVGFNGFNGSRSFNRWFEGGHSHYFAGDDFMRKYWVPLVSGGSSGSVDMRGEPRTLDVFIDGVARISSRCKFIYYAAFGAVTIAAIFAFLN